MGRLASLLFVACALASSCGAPAPSEVRLELTSRSFDGEHHILTWTKVREGRESQDQRCLRFVLGRLEDVRAEQPASEVEAPWDKNERKHGQLKCDLYEFEILRLSVGPVVDGALRVELLAGDAPFGFPTEWGSGHRAKLPEGVTVEDCLADVRTSVALIPRTDTSLARIGASDLVLQVLFPRRP